MNFSEKKILSIAGLLILAGFIIGFIVMAKHNWNFLGIGGSDMVTNSYEFTDDIESISIISETADIEFNISKDDKCRITAYEHEKEIHEVALKNGKLTVTYTDKRKWYEHISLFSFGDSTRLTISLPEKKYSYLMIDESTGDINIPEGFAFGNIDINVSTGDVKCYASADERYRIEASTGNIKVENASANNFILTVSTGHIEAKDLKCKTDLSLTVSTGRSELKNIKCSSFITHGSTGKLTCENLIASETIRIERSTGNVELDKCDAAELFIETSTGSVKGSLLSDKVFIVSSDTGKIDVPKTITGGRCEITTDTGNITFK